MFAHGPFTEIVYAGSSTDVFAKLCTLDLDVALWRVANVDERAISPHTLMLLEVDPSQDIEARIGQVAARASRHPVIVVASGIDEQDALAYLSAGAFGVFDPTLGDDVLRRQLLAAIRGEPLFARTVVGKWLRAGREARTSHAWDLTPRQREVLALIARGSTDRDIAAALGISIATAQKHVAHLLKKLGVTNRAAAVGRVLRGPQAKVAMEER